MGDTFSSILVRQCAKDKTKEIEDDQVNGPKDTKHKRKNSSVLTHVLKCSSSGVGNCTS